ncbi:Rhodanese-related sulfurtransferase [Humidesulfovibrio mexicanus]|uniref:Rhodanese-related sulfurtransferase n=1 Tax=Humidesulfovibrio mexicanus TaxID=147047 RepID=A0A238XQ89_9BACT|nr:rhodanese-like domain-containing protein [Humidesulfovibrio mexicanus]SNR60149.1 Rhodanese-related sulfurtransferase [Humidesulfovibrio mexicanus]
MTATVRQLAPHEAGSFLDSARLGERTLLDVRQDFEYAEGHLPGARHIPLPELSERLDELDRSLPVLVYCRSGVRSLAAANLLAGQGFAEPMSLTGGFLAWEGGVARGPADLGMQSLAAVRTVDALLERAWAMELALEALYLELAGRAADPERADVFRRLAGFEDKHRRVLSLLWSHYRTSKGEDADVTAFEARARAFASSTVLEGGVSANDYMSLMRDPDDSAEAMELAMAVEAQALDLYMRRSMAEADAELRARLTLLAEEERSHLKVLGNFVSDRGRL